MPVRQYKINRQRIKTGNAVKFYITEFFLHDFTLFFTQYFSQNNSFFRNVWSCCNTVNLQFRFPLAILIPVRSTGMNELIPANNFIIYF